MKTIIDKRPILQRIKDVKKISRDSDLASFLGINPSTLANWYTRNSIDYDLIFSKCDEISVDWLLTGEGEMLKDTSHKVEVKPLGIHLSSERNYA